MYMSMFDELRERISSPNEPLHIIAITEAKPKNNRYGVTQAEFQLENYSLYSRNIESGVGRGILVYIHNILNATSIETADDGCEELRIKVKLCHKDFYLDVYTGALAITLKMILK